jgi:membrane associated rhomboid family serine protease
VVIPVHDDNPTRRTPVVTYVLIAVNVVVFLLSPVAAHVVGSASPRHECQTLEFFDHWAAKPYELLHNVQLPAATGEVVRVGGHLGCQTVEDPSYRKVPFLSVLSAMFLHGGWLHLLGNMLFLFVFGNNVEDRLGRLRFLGFYVACGYAAPYGFALFQASSDQPLVGASGAIAGVLGAYLVLFPRARVTSLVPLVVILFPLRLPAWLVLGGWFLLQWLYSSGTAVTDGAGVAYLAHVFGFLAGAVIALAARSALGGGSSRGTYVAYDP